MPSVVDRLFSSVTDPFYVTEFPLIFLFAAHLFPALGDANCYCDFSPYKQLKEVGSRSSLFCEQHFRYSLFFPSLQFLISYGNVFSRRFFFSAECPSRASQQGLRPSFFGVSLLFSFCGFSMYRPPFKDALSPKGSWCRLLMKVSERCRRCFFSLLSSFPIEI